MKFIAQINSLWAEKEERSAPHRELFAGHSHGLPPMGHLHLVLSGSCCWELGFLRHICRPSHLSSHATNCRNGVCRLHSLATARGRIHQEIGPPDLLPQAGAVSTKRSCGTVGLDQNLDRHKCDKISVATGDSTWNSVVSDMGIVRQLSKQDAP